MLTVPFSALTAPPAFMRAAAAGLLILILPALIAAQPPTRDTASTRSQDSVRAMLREVSRDANRITRERRESLREPPVVTAAELSSAFADAEAKTILERARVARLQQDSALRSYRAITTQRMSLGMGVRRLGLEKLLFRGDNVARVEWSRGGGVWITPVGSRVVVPMAGNSAHGDFTDAVTVPYFPGKETLWMPSDNFGVVRADVDKGDVIHPIANGAEAYYRYATGDSITIRLDNTRSIRLRELRITARRPDWKLFVGSFWFDQESGQLVRAAYRLSVPIEFWDVATEEIRADSARSIVLEKVRDSLARERLPRDAYITDSVRRSQRSSSDDEPPGWVKAAFRPARGELDAITIEYGLYEQRFWLPRSNSASFHAQIGPLRTPFSIDEKYEYEEVNGDFFTLPVPPTARQRDSLRALEDSSGAAADSLPFNTIDRDETTISVSVGGDSLSRAQRDSVFRAQRCKEGDTTYVQTETRFNGALRVAYNMPCDREKLRSSAALPALNVSSKDLFDASTRDQLLDALGLSLQPPWAPQMPTVRTGLDLIRYNRVEGLSVALLGEAQLGAGYKATATARIGHADLAFNGEAGFTRSNGRRTVFGNVYRRLRATAPEWGDPLSFGPSLPAILYARDEGFYFRALGVEVGDRRVSRGGAFEWRLYTEQQETAGDSSVVNTFSIGRQLGIGQFRTNFDASRLSLSGVDVSWARSFGDNPEGIRLFTTVRGEGATGTVTFGRASLEAQMTRPIQKLAMAFTGSVGGHLGDLPPQRSWFLGGLRTVRGLAPGSAFGNAYWFLRSEAGTRFGAVRPVAFFDAGWAGNQDVFGQGGMLRGAGGGLSLLDGIIRLDVARGLNRGSGWRTDLYLQAAF